MSVREREVTVLAQEILSQPVVSRCPEEMVEALEECEKTMRVVMAMQLQLLAQIEDQGIPTQHGARSTKSWLQQRLRISGTEADSRLKVARTTAVRLGPDGEPLPPESPATAAALRNGSLGLDHTRTIVDGIRRVTPVLSPQQCAQAETLLVERARVQGPGEVRALAEQLRYRVDPVGAFRDEELQYEDRELHYAVARDGMTVLKGRLDRETGAKLRAALEPLAAPRPEQDGEKDPRTAGQRNADALSTLLDVALSSDGLPRAGGQRPHLMVTVSLDSLQQRLSDNVAAAGVLETTGQPLTAAQIRRIACDCEVLPMVLGGDGQPLNVGRAERTAPPHIRAALLARDGSCAFPDCDRPPGTGHAHHIQSWIDGGETSLSNMTMLCSAHHRIVHNQNWEVVMTNGRPVFLPPATTGSRYRPRPGSGPLRQFDRPPLIPA